MTDVKIHHIETENGTVEIATVSESLPLSDGFGVPLHEGREMKKLRRRLQERTSELDQARIRINALESKVRALEKYLPVSMKATATIKEEPRYKGPKAE